jgi:hypothetical protein
VRTAASDEHKPQVIFGQQQLAKTLDQADLNLQYCMSQVHNGYLRASKDLEHLHANPVYDFYYRNCSGSCDFRSSLADLSTSKLGSWGTEGTRIQRPLIWQVPIVIWPTYTSQPCDGNLQLPQLNTR